MKKGVLYTILGVLAAAVAFIYYYVTLPAINIHSSGFWFFIMAAIVAVMVVYTIRKAGKDMAGTGGVAPVSYTHLENLPGSGFAG